MGGVTSHPLVELPKGFPRWSWPAFVRRVLQDDLPVCVRLTNMLNPLPRAMRAGPLKVYAVSCMNAAR